MTAFWITLAILAFVGLTAVLLHRRSKRPWRPKALVTADEVIKAANGRTIIIGENHGDRAARKLGLLLMETAHAAGYRTLGVECSDSGHDKHPGLRSEISRIAANIKGELTESSDTSELDPNEDGKRPRMNRHWQIKMALCLGWNIVSIDPFYWNHLSGDAEGYLHSREPAMAEAISESKKPMIVICGYGHLGGLHRLLGDSVLMVNSSEPKLSDAPRRSFWMRRIMFALRVPRLTA